MKTLAAIALAAAALAACELFATDFRLSGTVDVAPRLRERAPKENAMLFIVAENAGGVPVAVHRIVNPEFPADFRMGPADLLIPALRRRESLKVHAEMNTHGDVGTPKPGDLEGDAKGEIFPGMSGVSVVLDRQR
jgi:hypothetical protein